MLAAVIYAPLHALGLRLDYGWNLSYYFIILFTVKVFWGASILVFRRALVYTSAPKERYTLLVLIYAFASLTFSWSATFSNHSLAGSSLMIAFYYYLRGKHGTSISSFLFSGLFLGLSASMDMPTAIFLMGFGVLVGVKWRLATETLLFWVGAIVPLSLHFVVNYSIGGTFLPLQIVQEFFVFEGSVWADSDALSGVKLNSLLFIFKYGFLCLFGLKGIMWYDPLLLILIPLIFLNLRKGTALKSETLVIAISSAILMSYYFLFSTNYGGWSYSIRWFVPLLPLIHFYLSDLKLPDNSDRRAILLWGLVISSIIIAGIGLINPWTNQDLHSIPILANLKQLMEILS